MYLLAPFILQNFKKFLEPIQIYEDVPFLGPKCLTCPEQNIFWYKPLLSLSSTYWHFSMSKILKTFYSGSRGMRMRHFWVQNGPFAPNFFGKIMNIILIYLLAPSIVQNFKKILSADPKLWWCAIFGPKMAHFPKWEFFRKSISEPYFFHARLSTCQKSKSDINLLVKYWRLKNTEISLAEIHFWL